MSSEEDRPQDQEIDPATAAKQRRDRLEQNRISARESRKRKKTMIEELQRTVITLSKENKELNERNEFLRRELVEIGTKHPGLVPIQALMRGGALAAVPVDEEKDNVGVETVLDPTPVPQAASSSGVASSTAGVNNNGVSDNNNNSAQQMALMQQMVQMQAFAGMNPAAMMNPALMGMMAGMGGVPNSAAAAVGGQQLQQQSAGGVQEGQGQGQGEAKSE
jgi:hypothetical protein